ncbi:hypothetical protein BGZ83_010818 [Gryganskiella cystojenkinii]|nr:hypothetical protein BGZ83_010818 [Gryganskiella cystojenkinii]
MLPIEQAVEPVDQERKQETALQKALALPELLTMIGQRSSQEDLVCLLRVSRFWHDTLYSLLWTRVTITFPVGIPLTPSLDTIRHHLPLIRHLETNADVTTEYYKSGGDYDRSNYLYFITKEEAQLLHCPNLESLTIARHDATFSATSKLIRLHQSSLTSLEITEVETQATTDELLEAIGGCRQLKRLSVDGPLMVDSLQWMAYYKQVWCRLLEIHLEDSWDEWDDIISKIETSALSQCVGPARIQELSICDMHSDGPIVLYQLWLISQCPDLVVLTWDHTWALNRPENGGTMKLMAEAIRTGEGHHRGWKKLKQLSLLQTVARPEDLLTLASSMTQLKELNLQLCEQMDMECWNALQPLYGQLTLLNFSDSKDLPGSVIQAMLCSLPFLENLCVEEICDRDIHSDPRPWICLRLKALKIQFTITSASWKTKLASQLEILTRLSHLVQLQTLDLSGSNGAFHDIGEGVGHAMHITMERGLDRLKTLSCLKEFLGPLDRSIPRGRKSQPEASWGKAEVAWVQEHWPGLQWVTAEEDNPTYRKDTTTRHYPTTSHLPLIHTVEIMSNLTTDSAKAADETDNDF